MRLVEHHILYLIESRGIVNVPGLGTFVSQRRSASFDGNTLLAPCVATHFEPVTEADDELAQSIARAESMSLEESNVLIEQEINDIIAEINSTGAYDLCGKGTIYIADEGELTFSADTAYNSIDSWLPQLSLKPIISKAKESPAEEISKESRAEFLRSLSRTASSAAAIAVFILLAFIVSQLPQRNHERQEAGIVLEQMTSTALPTTAYQQPADAALVLIFNTPEDASCEILEELPDKTIEEQIAPQGRYCLIIASLATRAEADKFLASHSGNLSLLEKDGRYRVVAASSDDYSALESLRSDYASAWICRR